MDIECSTCFESFTIESEVLSTPCGHIFHSDCINDWLDKGDLNCPQCTGPITDFALLRKIYLPFQKKSLPLDKRKEVLVENVNHGSLSNSIVTYNFSDPSVSEIIQLYLPVSPKSPVFYKIFIYSVGLKIFETGKFSIDRESSTPM